MKPVLLDTHAWAWSLTGEARLSSAAVNALEEAEAVYVTTVSLYEIGQKVRLGKWPEMATVLPQLIDIGEEQGVRFLPMTAKDALFAASFEWPHRDPFDRIIGAAALRRGFGLISADLAFDGLATAPGWPGRIW